LIFQKKLAFLLQKAGKNIKNGSKFGKKMSRDTLANPLHPPCGICDPPSPRECHELFE